MNLNSSILLPNPAATGSVSSRISNALGLLQRPRFKETSRGLALLGAVRLLAQLRSECLGDWPADELDQLDLSELGCCAFVRGLDLVGHEDIEDDPEFHQPHKTAQWFLSVDRADWGQGDCKLVTLGALLDYIEEASAPGSPALYSPTSDADATFDRLRYALDLVSARKTVTGEFAHLDEDGSALGLVCNSMRCGSLADLSRDEINQLRPDAVANFAFLADGVELGQRWVRWSSQEPTEPGVRFQRATLGDLLRHIEQQA